jgi:imidazolonepropionase-like amidohydrolase
MDGAGGASLPPAFTSQVQSPTLLGKLPESHPQMMRLLFTNTIRLLSSHAATSGPATRSRPARGRGWFAVRCVRPRQPGRLGLEPAREHARAHHGEMHRADGVTALSRRERVLRFITTAFPLFVDRYRGRLIAAMLVLTAACGCARAQPADTSPAALVIQGATLIDGNGGPVLADAVIVISGGRITAVGPRGGVEVPGEARVEDASGHYLIPGLIDVHAHALVPECEVTPEGPRFAGFDRALSERLARALLRFGITTARSPATPTLMGVALRDSIAAGAIPGPRLLVAGELINGGGMTPEGVREEVRAQAAAGVDYVKLYSGLAPEAVRAGIEEAHSHGLQAIGHLQRTTWTEGIAAGIDHLTHAAPWTEEMLGPEGRERFRLARANRSGMQARIDWLEALDPEGPEVGAVAALLADRRIPLDPTLVAFDTKFSFDPVNARPVAPRYRQNPNREAASGLPDVWERCGTPTDHWSADDFRRAGAAWPKLLALVRRYRELGVLLTAGSDTPNAWVIPGESLHRELELLVDAGIPPADVLRIATRNGAEALGLLDATGTVEPGKHADLVLLSADPLADISNTRRIVWIMRGGELYRPQDLE